MCILMSEYHELPHVSCIIMLKTFSIQCQTFVGNWHKDIQHGQVLGNVLVARFIRIISLDIYSIPAMRLGVFGCLATTEERNNKG